MVFLYTYRIKLFSKYVNAMLNPPNDRYIYSIIEKYKDHELTLQNTDEIQL